LGLHLEAQVELELELELEAMKRCAEVLFFYLWRRL
jgi:hypothetical protein